jgi:hypothetical protein
MSTITRSKPEGPRDISTAASKPAIYERDYYAWANEQAAFLASGDFDRLDLANLAEEIGDLGRSAFRAYASAYRALLLHMLKWDQQPERRSRSWWTSIAIQRVRIDEIISESPSLKSRVDEAIARAYREARLLAADETGLDLAKFPEICPYDPRAILSRPFDLG